MTPLLLLLPALSLLLLGAHFWRAADWWGVVAAVVLLALMLLRRAWVPRVLQVALVLGSLEWLWSALWLVQQRMALGQPWLRMSVILCAVALVCTVSAVLLQHGRVRRWYGAG